MSENLDGNQISKWAYPGMPSGAFGGATLAGMVPGGNRPPLYGDMFGDWREEVMYEQSGGAMLRIYSTAIPTDKRIYTLMHDPEYRNAMVEKGYTQSRFVDFYLGEGMTDPPRPNIKYPDGSGAAGAGGDGTTGTGGASGSAGRTGTGGAGSGGSILSGSTPSTGGAGATGGRSGGAGSVASSGGNPGSGGASVVVNTGGAAMAGAGGNSAVAAGTGGSTSSGAGGAGGGQSGTSVVQGAASSGCSCAVGASSGRASAGYFVVMLGVLGPALKRRRKRKSLRD